jgi:hypothetical protein
MFRRHETTERPIVAIIGREPQALDELYRYLRCCRASARSSTLLAHAAKLPARKGVLVLLGDHFAPAEVGATLAEVHTAEVVAALLLTKNPGAFADLKADRRIGPTLLILQAPVSPWIILATVRACFDAGTAPQA